MVKTDIFTICNYLFMLILMLIFLLPFLYVFNLSISGSFAVARGDFNLWPVDITPDAYSMVFRNPQIWRGYANSFIYSGLGTLLTMLICSLPAYVLTTREFKPKRSFTVYFAITMFFNGGIIPTFLVIRNLGLLDSVWAMVIPPALAAWYIILFRTNFKEIPDSLIESAKIDGASHFWIYAKIVSPLSKPIFAVVAIFSFISIWNSYFPALLYLTDQDKQPLMIILRKYVVTGNMRGPFEQLITTLGKPIDGMGLERTIRMATIIVSIAPIIIIYPLMQKYLRKGFMIGAIKG